MPKEGWQRGLKYAKRILSYLFINSYVARIIREYGSACHQMRVLFIAYGYKRQGKSESLTAYHLAHTIRDYGHTIKVLTGSPIEAPEGTQLETRFWLTSSEGARKLKLDYFEFIARAYLLARRLRGSYDLIHHISPISLRYPNPLGNLGVPFIWGPVGGSIDYPPGFETISKREPFAQRLRRFDRVRLSLDPMMLNTMKQATRIITTTNAARNVLPERYRSKSVVIPEGIALKSPPTDATTTTDDYIFCSARLVTYKAVDLLVRAYAQCQPKETMLWISGIGPEREHLETLIKDLNLQQRIKLVGKIIRSENMRLMAGARFCVFPALHEAFGQVNLEAMMVGKPVIVTDWGGPADIVEDGVTGFKVLGRNPDEHVELLAQRMSHLLRDPSLCRTMGKQAREHVLRAYSWEAIGRRHTEQYRLLLDNRT